MPWSELAGFAAATAVVIHLEMSRYPEALRDPQTLLAYAPNLGTTPALLALLAAPVFWWPGRRRLSHPDASPSQPCQESTGGGRRNWRWAGWLASLLLFLCSIALAWLLGQTFRGMPPAYHDEYSYLFQANTFLAGKLFFPQHALPEFFDQMHVLNDRGVFASRYFPGVGLWMTPWVALGIPYAGHYLAGGLTVVCLFWIGRELAVPSLDAAGGAGLATGILAGLFGAVSPAMLVFGNLLLSHHPTVLGLAGFVLCYLRSIRTAGVGWPLVGGIALCLAMLCRPLTAFGFALPFGVHLVWLLASGRLPHWRNRVAAALGPVIAGLIALGAYNAALTGSPLLSPYGLYTRIYAPCHMYGFYNVTRGQRLVGPKVVESYNNWAQELTPGRAVELLVHRWDNSTAWTLGRVSLAWFGAALLVLLPGLPSTWRLLLAALVGLHAVYFPYAFEGIFGLSYVFETVPCLCLLAAAMCVTLGRVWLAVGQRRKVVWLVLFVACAFLGPASQLVQRGPDGWLEQVLFARGYYAGWEWRMQQSGMRAPALVFIRSNPGDVHLNLVTNSPDLSGPILRARDLGLEEDLRLASLYPDRSIWFLDAQARQLRGGWSLAELREAVEAARQPPDR